jgi:hypothetical protein
MLQDLVPKPPYEICTIVAFLALLVQRTRFVSETEPAVGSLVTRVLPRL